jgi:methanogenic corrinoid protein MtbC1
MVENLINSLKHRYAVSADAAKAYEKSAERLVNLVNDDLEANPSILELIGNNPFDLMRNNHSNHAAFMTTVFKTASYELLARTIPWVYRAYRARGFSYDYFPVELAAWKRAVGECFDNTLCSEVVGIYDWLISHHEDMIQLSLNGEEPTSSLHAEATEMQEALLSLLLQGDSRGSLQLVNQSVKTIDDLKHFYLDVVCPVMHRVGLLWEKNVVSVAEEHVATAIIGRITAALYPLFARVDMSRGKVVVTAGSNEFHETGARMLADFLEMEGWDVTYLGANTPQEELLATLKRHKPFIVAISVATVFNLDHARQTIERIKADPETRDIKIMVGGLAFNSMPRLWSDFGTDGYAADANEGALSANAWWEKRIAS